MSAQICESCEHKHDRCYCSPNSTCDKYEPIKMVTKKSWDEFRNSGFLWWINMILQEKCEKPTPLGVGWMAQIMCM